MTVEAQYVDTRNIGDVGAADPDGKYSGKRMSRIYKERFYASRSLPS
jgi:hypothetical protein